MAEYRLRPSNATGPALPPVPSAADTSPVVVFRNHPSEKIGKYKDLLKKYNKKHRIIFSKNINLHDDINEADAVVGGQSMAMVMSLYAGKKVYSTLPKKSQKLLPHKKIIYLER